MTSKNTFLAFFLLFFGLAAKGQSSSRYSFHAGGGLVMSGATGLQANASLMAEKRRHAYQISYLNWFYADPKDFVNRFDRIVPVHGLAFDYRLRLSENHPRFQTYAEFGFLWNFKIPSGDYYLNRYDGLSETDPQGNTTWYIYDGQAQYPVRNTSAHFLAATAGFGFRYLAAKRLSLNMSLHLGPAIRVYSLTFLSEPNYRFVGTETGGDGIFRLGAMYRLGK